MSFDEDYAKTLKVIQSCKTAAQVQIAQNMVNQLKTKWGINVVSIRSAVEKLNDKVYNREMQIKYF